MGPGAPPAAGSSGRQSSLRARALWCATSPRDGATSAEAWPPGETAGGGFLVTNAPALVRSLLDGPVQQGWQAVDVAELHRLLFPADPAATLEEMLPPGGADGPAPCRRLWSLWQTCRARLDALPAWALEDMSLICREREEDGLAELFACQAAVAADGGSRDWTESFPPCAARGARPPLPALSDCTPLDPARVAARLDRGGDLSGLVPGYEPRPGQLTMLKAVVEAFNGGKHLVAEAGTGVGKSLAYLLPAAMWAGLNDVPVVISTNTKNLQSQLVEKDLPAVLAIAGAGGPRPDGRPAGAAVIKGRSNYLCLRRLGHLVEEAQFELSRPELRLFAQTLAWATTTPDGDLDALLGGASIDQAFLPLITSSSDECLGRACKYHRRCFVVKARARAMNARLVVANHALVFTELDSEAPVSLPPASQIVFDEAHNLEEAATRFFTKEFSPARVQRIQRRLLSGRGRSRRGILADVGRRAGSGAIAADPVIRGFLGLALDVASAEAGRLVQSGADVFHALHAFLGDDDAPFRYDGAQAGPVTAGRVRGDAGGDPDGGKGTPGKTAAAAHADTSAAAHAAASSGLDALRGDERTRELAEALVESRRRFSAPPPPPGAAVCADPRWEKVRAAFDVFRLTLAGLVQSLEEISGLLKAGAADELALGAGDANDLDNSAKALGELYSDAMEILAAAGDDRVYWIEHCRGGAALAKACAAPLDVGPFLAERLFGKRQSVVLCSATLRVCGSYKYISSRLGLDRVEPGRLLFCNAPSPFDYTRQCSLLVPSYLPEPVAQDRSYVTDLAGMVCRLAREFGGRTLVLFTSHEMLRQCAKLAGPALEADGFQLLIQGGSGSRNLITRVFRKDKRSVLFGTQSFWEGVDVVGAALSCVVVARLPFASPGDPVFSARCERLEATGASSFGELSLPAAVLRLRQGFGRLIRHRDDRGCVVLADTRVITKRYGKVFLRSLPAPARICETPEALAAEGVAAVRGRPRE